MSLINKGNLFLAEGLIEDIISSFEAVGLIAGVVRKDGEMLYQKSWGYADLEEKNQIDEDTIFGVASVTKSFTALSIMQMAERGIIDIDDRVDKHIPEFKGYHQEKVKIRHLLNHSGGFFPLSRILVYETAQELGLDDKEEDLAYSRALALEGRKKVAQRLSEQTIGNGLIGQPGEFFSYCNDGYGLLSEIIREYGGQASFPEYLEKNILKPLGMKRSFCDFLRAVADENSASLYKNNDGEMISSKNYYDNAFVLHGGGALKSTLKDLKKYVRMYLNQGVLGGVSLAKKHSITDMSRGSQDYLAKGSYGYGLSVKQLDDIKIIGHGGSLTGVSSNIAWSWELGIGVVVLCNTSNVPVGLISDALFRAFNGRSPLIARDEFREVKWDSETVSKVQGRYISGEGTDLVIGQVDGVPTIEVDGEKKLLIPINPKAALVREKFSDGYLELHFDGDGSVFALTFGTRIIPRVKEA